MKPKSQKKHILIKYLGSKINCVILHIGVSKVSEVN